MLASLQRGIEQLYRITTHLDVEDFLIDAEARARMGVARSPREQLLVREQDGELELGLFIDEQVVRKAKDGHLDDFLLAVEGVSHFVYVAWNARRERPVSAFELELQAEVDKYVTCVLTQWDGAAPPDLTQRLYGDVRYADDLDDEERERYRVANENARAYAEAMEARYLDRGQLSDMLAELRRFYRLGAQEKLAHIARAA